MLKTMFKKTEQQKGMTLLELLIAVAIIGILSAVLVTSIVQVISINASSGARMTALKQVERSIDRIRMDVQMAQEITTSDVDDPNVFLKLKWKEWDNTINEVVYTLDPTSHEMHRQSSGIVNQVAENIASVEINHLESGNWEITITATVEGMKPATEIRTFEIHSRTGI
jgi:prepilin-type N-terminal cleavage/methylation domain-containing protein